MVKQKVRITNPTGLHLRPAGMLCKEAVKYKCKVTFVFNDITANMKSVLSVLGACIRGSEEIEVICDGDDEEEALNNIIQVINSGLGE